MDTTENYKWISVYNLGKRLDLSIETVYRMIKSGEIPSYRFGGSIKVLETDFHNYLEKCKFQSEN